MNVWNEKLATAIELETIDISLLDDIDAILAWTSSGQTYTELVDIYGEAELLKRFEELLDRLVVGDHSVGEMFPSILSPDNAKKRYRQLIRVFHPDRGSKPEIWLNYRAEKINKAYKRYLELGREPVMASVDIKPGKPNKVKPSSVRRGTIVYRPNVWRERLGSPKEFQQKVLIALVLVSLLLISVVYFSNDQGQLPKSEYVVVSESADSEVVNSDAQSYVLNERAKAILLEADQRIAEFDQPLESDADLKYQEVFDASVRSGVSELSGEGLVSVSLPETKNKIAKSEKEVIQKAVKGRCHDYESLEVMASSLNQRFKLVKAIQVYDGPSLSCSVLTIVKVDSSLVIDAKTADGLWSRLDVNAGDPALGWVLSESLKGEVVIQEELLKGMEAKLVNEKAQSVVGKRDQVVADREKEGVIALTDFQVGEGKEVVASDELVNNDSVVVKEVQVVLEPVDLSDAEPEFLQVVEKLKRSYEIGDSDALAALYISSGRENELRGVKTIQKYYKKAFPRIVNRTFDYTISSYIQEDDATALVRGEIHLSFLQKSSKKKFSLVGDFSILMVKVGVMYKIATFEWEEG